MKPGYPTRPRRYRKNLCPECYSQAKREAQSLETGITYRRSEQSSADCGDDAEGIDEYWGCGQRHGYSHECDGFGQGASSLSVQYMSMLTLMAIDLHYHG
jgi:hypothetical protein